MLNQNSIIYGSLMDEYKRNKQMQELSKRIIEESPKGSIQRINRGSKSYYYLKYRDGAKVESKYLGALNEEEAEEICNQIEKRKKHEILLRKLKAEAKWLKRELCIED